MTETNKEAFDRSGFWKLVNAAKEEAENTARFEQFITAFEKAADRYEALAAERDALQARVAELETKLGQSDADLDDRMVALGMIPQSQLLAEPPSEFSVHVACNNLGFFKDWVAKKHEEYLRMRLRYETGQIEKDDLYEWVFAFAGAFGQVHDHLRQALKETQDV